VAVAGDADARARKQERERQKKQLERAQAQVRYWRNPEPFREANRARRLAQDPAVAKAYRQGRKDAQAELARAWKEANRAKHRLQKRAQKARRKARLRAVTADRGIHWSVLYLRDKGLCGICGKPVRYSSDDASTDHIVPLGPPAGGTHTWDNVRLAHQTCNTRRRRQMTDDLHLLLSSDPAAPSTGGDEK
jgi:5-methylcytosine-specific restriction endonuclease McrA